MAVQGPTTVFDRALAKFGNPVNWGTDTFHYVLCTNAQVLDPTFVGGSGDARYADLTGELTTALGYTVGGVSLTGPSTIRPTTARAAFQTSGSASWTFSAPPTFKYGIIVDWTTTNKDLLAICDFDTTSTSTTISPIAGPWAMNPDATNGWFYWSR
jgi:hypothetical protein